MSVSNLIHKTSNRSLSSRADDPLANEKLVATLIKKSGGLSAQELQVRVMAPSGSGAKPKPLLMSLADAISMSIEHDNKDLIALAIDQDIPVLRMDHLNSFLYKQGKKATKAIVKKQPEKEFRFNAGIEENDLKRKVESIAETLDKGVPCIVSVRCKGWMLNKDPDIVQKMAKRVIESLRGVAELMNEVKVFGDGTRAQFRLRPAK